jgi:AhpD family alkylhydroperoxidase
MDTTSVRERQAAGMADLKQQAPDIPRAFGGMFAALMKPGALGAKEKELIALGISIALRCEPCIWSHVEKCLKAGATREEILEAGGVAVVMQGGPSYTYIPRVLEALDHLASAAPA